MPFITLLGFSLFPIYYLLSICLLGSFECHYGRPAFPVLLRSSFACGIVNHRVCLIESLGCQQLLAPGGFLAPSCSPRSDNWRSSPGLRAELFGVIFILLFSTPISLAPHTGPIWHNWIFQERHPTTPTPLPRHRGLLSVRRTSSGACLSSIAPEVIGARKPLPATRIGWREGACLYHHSCFPFCCLEFSRSLP